MNAMIWIAYDADGNHACSPDGEQEAIDALNEVSGGITSACRVVQLDLELPEIKPINVSAAIPETDGPIAVTIG